MDKAEKEAIEKAQQGDIRAFTELVDRYDRQVLQLACSLVGNIEDARDIYQEVFVRVYKKISGFKFGSEFSTWLYRVVVNICINFQKKNRRSRQHLSDEHAFYTPDDLYSTKTGDAGTPEQSLLNHELSTEIEAALLTLSPKQKTVFIMRHYHGHKLREIAEILNCSEGTVKNYLFRATQKMQTQLRDYANI